MYINASKRIGVSIEKNNWLINLEVKKFLEGPMGGVETYRQLYKAMPTRAERRGSVSQVQNYDAVDDAVLTTWKRMESQRWSQNIFFAICFVWFVTFLMIMSEIYELITSLSLDGSALYRWTASDLSYWLSIWNWFDICSISFLLIGFMQPFVPYHYRRVFISLEAIVLMPQLYKRASSLMPFRLLVSTLKHAAFRLQNFLISLILTFLFFSVAGHCLFGPVMHEWHTVGHAIPAMLKVMISGFALDDQLRREYPEYAYSFFFVSNIVFTMVMSNLFVAILIHSLTKVSEETDRIQHDMYVDVHELELWDNYSDLPKGCTFVRNELTYKSGHCAHIINTLFSHHTCGIKTGSLIRILERIVTIRKELNLPLILLSHEEADGIENLHHGQFIFNTFALIHTHPEDAREQEMRQEKFRIIETANKVNVLAKTVKEMSELQERMAALLENKFGKMPPTKRRGTMQSIFRSSRASKSKYESKCVPSEEEDVIELVDLDE
jgi:hypothetical protein